MGAACVYLAAKVEERSNVKLSHIVLQYLIFNGHLRQGMTFADYQADAKKDVSDPCQPRVPRTPSQTKELTVVPPTPFHSHRATSRAR
jgi:hypothetical protein